MNFSSGHWHSPLIEYRKMRRQLRDELSRAARAEG